MPKHQQIVVEILGTDHPFIFTKAIGLIEIGMAIWIISRISSRLNAISQILIVTAMNILETTAIMMSALTFLSNFQRTKEFFKNAT